MTDKEKENRINSFALTFLERQQIRPNIFADQIMRAYKEGYRQAEKDNELTWEDIRNIYDLAYNLRFPHKKQKEFFEEVLKRFKETKD